MNIDEVFDALKLAARWQSIKGRTVILTQTMHPRVSAVDPTAYWPIRYEYSILHTRAHLLAYRYFEYGEHDSYFVRRIPNRIRFVIYDPENGLNEVRTHALAGYTVGPMLRKEPTKVTGIFAIGQGYSDYRVIESPIRELMIRRATDLKVLAENSSPFIQAPNIPPAEVARLRKEGLPARGGLLFRDPGGFGWDYVEHKGSLQSSFEITGSLKSQIYTLASVPPTAFGEVLEGDESGVAIGRLMHAALTKVKEYRLSLERIIPGVLDGMGAPKEDTYIKWIADPWASEAERTATVLSLVHAKIISPRLAASMLDLPIDPDMEAIWALEMAVDAAGGTGANGSDPKEPQSVKPESSRPAIPDYTNKPGRPPAGTEISARTRNGRPSNQRSSTRAGRPKDSNRS